MQADLLAEVVTALEMAEIDYMVTGSFASTYHGEPRMTRDIDLVIDPTQLSIELFIQQFDPERFYIDDAVAAVMRRDMFNLIDSTSGWKVDLIIRKDRPYSEAEFGRRRAAEIAGVSTYVASVEDTILSKLEWSKASGSERQLLDVIAMLTLNRTTLDNRYLDRWARELDVLDDLSSARREAGLQG